MGIISAFVQAICVLRHSRATAELFAKNALELVITQRRLRVEYPDDFEVIGLANF